VSYRLYVIVINVYCLSVQGFFSLEAFYRESYAIVLACNVFSFSILNDVMVEDMRQFEL